MQYELWLSTGSQEGPYRSKAAAKLAALTTLSGDRKISHIDIKTHSISDETVARITRKDYYMVAEELGETKSPTTAKIINLALFDIKTAITLYDVKDITLENSEVLHPDVLKQLQDNLEDGRGNFEITLVDVFELNRIVE